MLNVSNDYNPYNSRRILSANVRFGIFDATAQEKAVGQSSYSAPMSQISQVKTGGTSAQKIDTLEESSWLLDGSGILMPTDLSGMYTGWWSSELSNSSAVFGTPPVITFTFDANVSCVGYTLNFNPTEPWSIPTSIKISTYDEQDTLIEEETYTNDELIFVAEMPTVNMRRVDFTFLASWMPRQRIKLDGVQFGILKKYNDDDIVGIDFVEELSPDMSSLPASAIEITLNNADHAYNMTNPNSIYRFLNDQQKVYCDIEVNGEVVKLCDWQYVSSSSSDEGMTAAIKAGTWAYQLEDCRYNIGESGTFTFGQAISAVKTASAINFDVDIDSSILNRTVSKSISRNTKCRNALALFAQAAQCVVYFDRNNVLKATDLDLTGTAVDTLDNDKMSRVPQLTLTKRINRVIITVRDDYSETEYSASSTNAETGESIRAKTYDNSVAYSRSDVARWLRQTNERRINYKAYARGNPAIELGDLVGVTNAYGEADNGNVAKNTISYRQGLTQTLKLFGGKWSTE